MVVRIGYSKSAENQYVNNVNLKIGWGGGGGGTVQTEVVRIGYSKSAENQYVNNVNLKIGWGGGGGHSSNGGG